MPRSRIFSVGYRFPGGEVERIGFGSDQSLLDADIIVFEPSLGHYITTETYQGRHLLGEESSFRVKERLSHWRSELNEAFDAGKLVVVFLAKPDDVFVYTGDEQFSGTGRNQKVTKIVRPASSYDSIPLKLERLARSGREIAPTSDLGFLAPYWAEFKELSPYEVTVDGKFSRVLLRTKSGNAIVGAAALGNPGALVLLPPLRYYDDDYDDDVTPYDELEEVEWNEEEKRLGRRLSSALVKMERAIRAPTDITPPPGWAQDERFVLPREADLHSEIRTCTEKIKGIQERRSSLQEELREVGSLRALLYGRGKELERAIIEALTLFGFSAEPFVDEQSEFDVVFSSAEGRFLGEAEGKDKRAVNIDKLSQLERNIQEDFTKEDVDEYAKGVLFGNAHRLTAPSDRPDAFTTKCVAGAKRSGIALVDTPDMFQPARYLLSNKDEMYAEGCRHAIADASGSMAKFPNLPKIGSEDAAESQAEE